MELDSIYLGNSLVFGRKRTKALEKLKERVQSRLEGWKNKLLSKTEKATFIKSVVQAIPIYSIATFKVPQSTCDAIDSMVRRFWWGGKEGSNRFLAFKEWTDICKPKWYRVVDLRLEDGSGWNYGLLNRICEPYTVEAISKIKWPQHYTYDRLLWIGNRSDCPLIRAMAFDSKKSCKIEFWKANSSEELVEFCVKPPKTMICDGFLECEVAIFDSAMEEFSIQESNVNISGLSKENVFWRPPQVGWFKANTDASFKNGQAVLTLVVRNDRGCLILVKSCDAKAVVEDIMAEAEPTGWDTYHEVLAIRRRLSISSWILSGVLENEVSVFSLSLNVVNKLASEQLVACLGGIRSLKTVGGSQPNSKFRQLFRYVGQATQRRWDGHATDDVIHPLNKDESVPAVKYLLYTVAGAAVSYVLYGPHYSFYCSLKVAGAADCFVLERKEALLRKLEKMMHILDEKKLYLLRQRHQIEELIQSVEGRHEVEKEIMHILDKKKLYLLGRRHQIEELIQSVDGQRCEVEKLNDKEMMHILDKKRLHLLGRRHQIEELIKSVDGQRHEVEKLTSKKLTFREKFRSGHFPHHIMVSSCLLSDLA
ncbi:hypothetical protein FNV43_RR12946 [Rhamnella rubrinervis]|uniref:Uncharacterized protein n=1 Tax=Rhamnella rubrinervis TaxID=2594499 RepID=A0A8K0H058_9ROSA|nr:hypothetical protein FNV43_RR12946 [Rhamnella rubrinervis]